MVRPLFIFDLDGTLCDNRHRKHLAPPKDKMHIDTEWHTWGEACLGDVPYPDVVTTLQTLRNGGADVWFWSARSERHVHKTAFWLFTHVLSIGHGIKNPTNSVTEFVVERHNLRMRPDRVNGADHALKVAWLAEMSVEDRARLVGIFEDRNSVVRAWREAGVTCFQVQEADW